MWNESFSLYCRIYENIKNNTLQIAQGIIFVLLFTIIFRLRKNSYLNTLHIHFPNTIHSSRFFTFFIFLL